MDRLKDPKVIGPGIWYIIHLKGMIAKDISTKVSFIKLINELSVNFPCLKCRNHINEYLEHNPITLATLNEPEGLFKWSWEFHNAVNKRLGKNIIDYQSAKRLDSDINKIGPGIWYLIHMKAALVEDIPSKVSFIIFIEELSVYVPNMNNLANFINKHPIDKDVLYWSWKLHDYINRILGKKSVDYELVKKAFYGSEVCVNCGE
jgi:hypothetical protein